jgi:hypothetical protein
LWGGGVSSVCGPSAEARRRSRAAVARWGRRRRGGKGADERGQAVRGRERERACAALAGEERGADRQTPSARERALARRCWAGTGWAGRNSGEARVGGSIVGLEKLPGGEAELLRGLAGARVQRGGEAMMKQGLRMAERGRDGGARVLGRQ